MPLTLVDAHTHHAPQPAGSAIENVSPAAWNPRAGALYSVGIHPWEAQENINLAPLIAIASHPQVAAIGETGLDKLRGAWGQLPLFREQILLSEQVEKPLIIHCVKMSDLLLEVRREMKPRQPWILHGFRGKPQEACQWLAHGLYLSIGEHFNEAALGEIPLNHLLVESDESELPISQIYDRIAHVLGLSAQALTGEVTANLERLFVR